MFDKNILPKEFKAPPTLSGLPKDTSILVGFSGGADSSALLLMLKIYSEQSGAKIYAAHLNHGIRGAEADRDESFCREFAKSLDIEFFSLKLDIPSMAKESGESIESEARNARYDFFNKLMSENSIPILATAHNADDNLETVIFNLTRGAGLSGLCGIPDSRPTASGIVIRPILAMEKKDIVAFCVANKINYVTDSTNADNEYTRNKIRNQIIPLLKEINSGVIKNTSRATEALKNDSICLQDMTARFIKEHVKNNQVEIERLFSLPTSILNRAIINIYSNISGGKALETVHINAIKKLAKRSVPHSSTSLPHGIDAVIENGLLSFTKSKKITNNTNNTNFVTKLTDGLNSVEAAKIDIFVNIEPYSKNIYKKSILLFLQSDKINGELIARNRQSGDKIISGGFHKSVKKLMNEKKIPLELRSRIPIICDENGIVAIPFVTMRDGVKSPKDSAQNTKIKITVCIR